MKYLSLDLETTSLNPSPNNILMLSAVVEDTKNIKPLYDLPNFTCYIKHEEITGSAYALSMNHWILDIISGRAITEFRIYDENEWQNHFKEFCRLHFGNKKITLAGKNVAGFDFQFLPKDVQKLFRHRCIDPSILYVDWDNDTTLPDMASCLKRAELPYPIQHHAYEDALYVIGLLRKFYRVLDTDALDGRLRVWKEEETPEDLLLTDKEMKDTLA